MQEQPVTWNLIATVALTPISAFFGLRAVHWYRAMARDADSIASSLYLVRAIRSLVLLICGLLFLAAVLWSSRVLLLLATVILIEEIYETGVALLILRAEKHAS